MKTAKLETVQEYENRTGKTYQGLIVAARNVRSELKAAFPGVKFSVRTSRFSGGDSLDISWTDGPTTKQVEEVTNKYKAGSFDGMVDLYTYNTTEFTEKYGDAKYIGTSRKYSVEFLEKVAQIVSEKYGKEAPAISSYNNGDSYFNRSKEYVSGAEGDYHWNMEQVANRKAYETSAEQLDEEFNNIAKTEQETVKEKDVKVTEQETDDNLFQWGNTQYVVVYTN